MADRRNRTPIRLLAVKSIGYLIFPKNSYRVSYETHYILTTWKKERREDSSPIYFESPL